MALPQRVKETAKKNYQLWQGNPFHPSLEFKEIKSKENIWSVRVGIGWRALGVVKANETLYLEDGEDKTIYLSQT